MGETNFYISSQIHTYLHSYYYTTSSGLNFRGTQISMDLTFAGPNWRHLVAKFRQLTQVIF